MVRHGARRAWPGQALVLAAVLLPFLVAVIGLAIDGAMVFAVKRGCQGVADGAARAGAMELDIATYRRTDGQLAILDTPLAAQESWRYLDARGWSDASVGATSTGVTVVAGRSVELGFLRLFGLGPVRVTATGYAVPYHGIAYGEAP